MSAIRTLSRLEGVVGRAQPGRVGTNLNFFSGLKLAAFNVKGLLRPDRTIKAKNSRFSSRPSWLSGKVAINLLDMF